MLIIKTKKLVLPPEKDKNIHHHFFRGLTVCKWYLGHFKYSMSVKPVGVWSSSTPLLLYNSTEIENLFHPIFYLYFGIRGKNPRSRKNAHSVAISGQSVNPGLTSQNSSLSRNEQLFAQALNNKTLLSILGELGMLSEAKFSGVCLRNMQVLEFDATIVSPPCSL